MFTRPCRWLALSLLLALPLSATAVPPLGERQQELRRLLQHDCGSCHGLHLGGGLGPALSPASINGKSLDYLSMIILDGLPGSAMPGWRGLLSAADARWLAQLLQSGEMVGDNGS